LCTCVQGPSGESAQETATAAGSTEGDEEVVEAEIVDEGEDS
jgi:hypothetical protein